MYLWGLDRKIILAIFLLWYTAVYCIVFNSLTQICVKYSSLCPQLYVCSLASAPPKGASQLGWPVLSVHSSQCPKGARNAELNYSVLLKAPPSAHTGWECLMVVCVCGQPCAGVEKRTCLRSFTSSRGHTPAVAVFVWAVSELWRVCYFWLGMGILGLFSAFFAMSISRTLCSFPLICVPSRCFENKNCVLILDFICQFSL